MKKILFSLILVFGVITSNAQSNSKSFYYDGIEMHNVKGWSITPSKDEAHTYITCTKPFGALSLAFMNITKSRIKAHNAMNLNNELERLLSQEVEKLIESSMNGKGRNALRIKETGNIMDGYINATPAKYVDVTYQKGVKQRIYMMVVSDYFFTIACSTGTGKLDKTFSKILSSFTFTPESKMY